MKKEEIHLWDIKRILLGQANAEFLLEVLIRSLVIYIATIIIMRLLGKRMNGQLTIVELAVMVTMGAILAVPMQMPERGILQGVFVLLLTLVFLRGINWIGFKNKNFEELVQGEFGLLIKDGIFQVDEMRKMKITKQELFTQLRNRNILHTGKIKRMYIEACGAFSIYEEERPRPGLPVFPPDDREILKTVPNQVEGVVVCIHCGAVQEKQREGEGCANCGNHEWSKAII